VNELPKSVRDELARQQRSSAVHPDADLLTAFAEGTATPTERAKLEEHLASCKECREVLFLAARPAVESAAPVGVVEAKTGRSWFRAWAPWATAAVVLVVATFTFINKDNAPQPKTVAKVESSPVTAQKQPSVSANSSPTPESELTNGSLARSTNVPLKSAPEALDALKQKDAKVAAGRRDKEDIGTNELKKSEADTATGGFVAGSVPSAAPIPPPSAATVETYSANRAARSTTLKPGPAAPAQNQVMQNQQNQSLQDLRASRSTEAVEVTAEASAPVAESQAKSDQMAGANAFKIDGRSPSQWRISGVGNVERSMGGNWSTALAQPGTKFTVIATIGPIVWAGGTRGILLRSVDNGASWQSIQLPNLSTGANSTITKIEFRDAFNGTVYTADHRSWSTKDRGENWQQP
jgi:hypothetical protein